MGSIMSVSVSAHVTLVDLKAVWLVKNRCDLNWNEKHTNVYYTLPVVGLMEETMQQNRKQLQRQKCVSHLLGRCNNSTYTHICSTAFRRLHSMRNNILRFSWKSFARETKRGTETLSLSLSAYFVPYNSNNRGEITPSNPQIDLPTNQNVWNSIKISSFWKSW